jgi:hypothetical protein
MKILIRDTTYYQAAVVEIATRLDSSRWELGDMLLDAYRDLGDEEYAMVVEGSGLSPSTCSQARWVANAYHQHERGLPFSWSVYRAFAALAAPQRAVLCGALVASGKRVTVQEAELLADLARTMTPNEIEWAVATLGEAASPAAIETALGRASEPPTMAVPQTRIDYVLGRIAEQFPWARGQRWQTVLRAAIEIALEWETVKPEAAPVEEWFEVPA